MIPITLFTLLGKQNQGSASDNKAVEKNQTVQAFSIFNPLDEAFSLARTSSQELQQSSFDTSAP